MTDEEAKNVCEILLVTHGECPFCAAKLIEYFICDFPKHSNLAELMYKEKYGSDYLSMLNK